MTWGGGEADDESPHPVNTRCLVGLFHPIFYISIFHFLLRITIHVIIRLRFEPYLSYES